MLVSAVLVVLFSVMTAVASDDVIAVTDNGVVFRSEFEEWQRYQTKTRQPPEDLRHDVESLVLLRALDARACELGLDRTPAALESHRRRETQAAITMLKRDVLQATQPTDAAIQRAYEERKERWRQPQRWRLENLFKRFPVDASDADKEDQRRDLEVMRERIQAGADFATLARQESDSLSSAKGGRLGVVRLKQLAVEFRAPVAELRAGDVSPVIESVDGLTVLRCTEFFDAQDTPYEMAYQQIGSNLHHSAFEAVWGELIETLLARYASQAGRGADGQEPADPNPGLPPRELIDRLLVEEAQARGLLDPDTFRSNLKFAMMEANAESALDHDASALAAPPSAEDVEAYFKDHRQRFQEPELRLLHAADVELSATVPREALRSMEISREEILRSEKSLANAALGMDHGEFMDLGWRTRRDLASEFPDLVSVAFELEKGQLSDVLQQDTRLVLLQLIDVQPQRQLVLGEVRSRIENQLMRRRMNAAKRTIRARVLDAQKLQIVGEATSR